jgi:ribosomal-protein-alanine N-acetyltransferase
MSRPAGSRDWRIRAIGSFDLELVAALHAACFAEPWSREALGSLLSVPGVFGLLAEDGAVPTGFLLARVAADEAEILSLGVIPSARRGGWGSRLLECALGRLEGEGACWVYLEVAEDNSAAIALYRSLGFRPVGRRASYYGRSGGRGTGALVLARGRGASRPAGPGA